MSDIFLSPQSKTSGKIIVYLSILLWGLMLVWMGVGAMHSGSALLFPDPRDRHPSDIFSLFPAAHAFLSLDLWTMAALFALGFIVANPMKMLNTRRMIVGSMAFGMVAGRLLAGWSTISLQLLYVPDIWLPVITPVLLLISGVIVIAIISVIVGTIFGVFVGFPVMIFNQIFQFEKSLAVFRYQKNGLAGYIVRFVFWLRNEPIPTDGPDDSKGARFATDEEILALSSSAPDAIAYGHLIEQEPLFLKTEKHVLIMASTRSGKGVALIIPHLLRYPGSVFVLDPKGENAKATGRRREQINQKVHYLDPFGISGKRRSRFNPMKRFTPENMEAESKALAAALFVVGDRERDHWTAAGQQLLAAIIMFVYVSKEIPPEKKDLPTVRKVLLGALRPTLEAMTLIDDADGLLRDLAVSFLETPEKEFGSVVSTAQRQTEILDNPNMIACLSASGTGEEVDFKQWRSGTMSVFLCLAAPKFPTFNRWLRLVLTSALDEMTDTLNPPKLPVSFVLDELATLGHLAPIENAVGLAAGYGVQLICVFQDIAQMKDLYKGRWASFVGNAGIRALFNLDDFDTAEYWSKFIGGRLVETRGRHEDLYGYSDGNNIGEAMRPLLSTDRLMTALAADRLLVLTQGQHPIAAFRVPYFKDRTLAGLWDDPRAPAPKPQPTHIIGTFKPAPQKPYPTFSPKFTQPAEFTGVKKDPRDK